MFFEIYVQLTLAKEIMTRLTLEKHYQIIHNSSEKISQEFAITYRGLRNFYGTHNRSFTGSMNKPFFDVWINFISTRWRNPRTEENIDAVNESPEQNPNLSIHRRSHDLRRSWSRSMIFCFKIRMILIRTRCGFNERLVCSIRCPINSNQNLAVSWFREIVYQLASKVVRFIISLLISVRLSGH